jgi:hypothetical protein
MVIPTAVVYKVKKEDFKTIHKKMETKELDMFIRDKIKFLEERRKFLSMKDDRAEKFEH